MLPYSEHTCLGRADNPGVVGLCGETSLIALMGILNPVFDGRLKRSAQEL
jgi:hypothetical protein